MKVAIIGALVYFFGMSGVGFSDAADWEPEDTSTERNYLCKSSAKVGKASSNSRKDGLKRAKRAWADFVGKRVGRDWSKAKDADVVDSSCDKSGKKYSCVFKAKPCLKKKVLSVNVTRQNGRPWCWAASSMMVVNYYHPGRIKRLCEAVNVGKKLKTCCDNPDSDKCDKGGSHKNIARIFDHYGVGYKKGRALSLKTVQEQIAKGRPVSVGYRVGPGKGSHCVVFGGFNKGKIRVFDGNRKNPYWRSYKEYMQGDEGRQWRVSRKTWPK